MGNDIALIDRQVPMKVGSVIPALNNRFKVKNHVTRSVLRQEENPVFFILMQSIMRRAPDREGDMEPPIIADVLNLETGEFQTLICNAVFENEMERNYPENAYIGRYFAVSQSKGAINPETGKVDKRYRTYKILEIEPNEDGDTLVSSGHGVIDASSSEAVERTKASRKAKKGLDNDAEVPQV